MSQLNAPDLVFRSWDANADAWTRLVRSRGIESRRIATDAAIIEAIISRSPARVLDVGCGEGWLCHVLTSQGCDVVGVDGSAALIEAARSAGGGEFYHLTYDEIASAPQQLGLASYGLIVCNFSLLHESVAELLRSMIALLTPGGTLLIQTVHPWTVRGAEAYADGWRVERFDSFGGEFEESMPWYYRTLSSWTEELRRAGFRIDRIVEPSHPDTGDPLSLVFVAQPPVA